MTTVQAAREAVVRAHMDAESAHDFAAARATFAHPRYEIVPGAETFDGAEAVDAFYAETHGAFPDFTFEDTRLHHTTDSVVVETTFVGTHRGPWRGLPPTGRTVRYRMCNVFEFDGADLMCERLFFDRLVILQQLGLARDPTSLGGRIGAAIGHPVTVIGAWLFGWRHRR